MLLQTHRLMPEQMREFSMPRIQFKTLQRMVDAIWCTGEEGILTPFVDLEFASLPPCWLLRQMEQLRKRP